MEQYETSKQVLATLDSQLIPKITADKLMRMLDFCASIKQVVISDEQGLAEATALNQAVTGKFDDLENDRLVLTRPRNDEVKKINAAFKVVTVPLANVQEVLRKARGQYMTMLEDKHREEQRRADALAEKERQRLLNEAREKAEQSQKAADKGRDEKATDLNQQSSALQAMAENVEPVKITPAAPKIEGVSFRDKWSCKVVDKKMAVRALLDMGMEGLVEIDLGALDKLAQSGKGELTIAGVKILYEKIPVDRKH